MTWPEDLAEIEAPVRELVRVMNEIPGLVTLTSCGGHPEEEIQYLDQWPEGSFYVTFLCEDTYLGWDALNTVADVIGNDGRVLGINVDGDEEIGVTFSLNGYGSISADDVAHRLQSHVQALDPHRCSRQDGGAPMILDQKDTQ